MADLALEGSLVAGLEAGGGRGVLPWDGAEAISGRPGGPRSRLYGVDSPLAYGLVRSYSLAGFMEEEAPEDLENSQLGGRLEDYCMAMSGNPFARRAWEDAVSALEERERAVFSGGLDRCADFKRLGPSIPERAFLDFFQANNAAFTALANDKFLAGMGLSEALSPWRPGKVDLAALRSARTVMSSVRDRDMSDNIADLYCLAASEGKALAVSIGGGHLPGVRSRLEQWSRGLIPLRTAFSYAALFDDRSDEEAALPLFGEIRRLAGAGP
jgi:hypothetical protein